MTLPAGTDIEATPDSAELSGQVALVTGAAGALGTQFAETLAAGGADVVLADIREPELEKLAAQFTDAGTRCEAIRLDLTQPELIPELLDGVESRLGQVSVLVNNAGINDAMRPHRMPLQLSKSLVNTNLLGPYALSCEVARRLISAKRPGRIVNISSMSAFSYHGATVAPLYAITKAAVARMTEVLAVEWARYDINVNAIAPGLFWSEMTTAMVERVGDPSDSMPRGRLGRPDQLESTLRYLVSPRSDAVTGTVIKVDDGQKPR
jgi:NAD(P)-dependent dehydrogenase (short-subunit alcohol dehydrogenase family)